MGILNIYETFELRRMGYMFKIPVFSQGGGSSCFQNFVKPIKPSLRERLFLLQELINRKPIHSLINHAIIIQGGTLRMHIKEYNAFYYFFSSHVIHCGLTLVFFFNACIFGILKFCRKKMFIKWTVTVK